MGCTESWVHHPVVLVLGIFLGEAVGGLVGFSSPGFLGAHSPGTPNLGGPFPLHLCGMADVVCSIPHAFQDYRRGPRVVVSVVRDVPFHVGGLPLQ